MGNENPKAETSARRGWSVSLHDAAWWIAQAQESAKSRDYARSSDAARMARAILDRAELPA